MSVAKGNALPVSLPPRGLSRQQAAEYVGLCVTSFDKMVDTRTMPKAVKLGGKFVWDRQALDKAFGELSSDDTPEIDLYAGFHNV